MKKSPLKLKLETVRHLTSVDLCNVVGGGACSKTREISQQCATGECSPKPWTGITG